MEDYVAAFDEWTVQTVEAVDLGNGIAYFVNRQDGRPVGSAARVQSRVAFTAEWVEGMVGRIIVSYDIDEARAAAERLAQVRE